MKYRKKSVVIEAFQYTKENQLEGSTCFPKWLINAMLSEIFYIDNYGVETISTLRGNFPVMINDWIIKKNEDDFDYCKPDIFELTYKEVQSEI